ncbi:MAG: DUF1553 domain-containing protein [Limisphaerales bacterium]
MKLPAIIALLAWLPALAAAPAGDRVDFNAQIRPLLSDRCFACHGPDDAARKARLGLHTREGALKGGKSGDPALKPGDPSASPLLGRIVSTDPDEVMPPPESKLPALTKEEIELLRRWIAEGAEYRQHWAFEPLPEAVPVPEIRNPQSPIRNAIDAFVLARLEKEKLQPQPEATRETLLRRASLDLTGLPPTPAEITAFLADPSPDAYEQAVDRLLDSRHRGERLAGWWLDLARYADTYGYQADAEVDFSPWRDWVIAAFNDNLPYDDFLTWQLAGDLLPGAPREAVLATAFNRLHRQTNEGGSIEEEFRTEYVADRVNTVGTAMLGLTVECARCHDHKYDPVSQRDYYSLFAFFNSIDESGLYSHFTRATPTPTLPLWQGDQEREHAAVVGEIRAAEAALKAGEAAARERFKAWSAQQRAAGLLPVLPAPVVSLSFESITNNVSPNASSTNAAELSDGPVLAAGRAGQAMRFSGDNAATVKHAAHFRRTDPFSFSLWVKPETQQPRAVVFHHSRAWTDSASRGYELVLDEGRPFFGLIHFWPGNALAVRAREPLATNAWSHLAVTYDGSSHASGLKLFVNGEPAEVETIRDSLTRDIIHRAEWGDGDAGNIHLTLAARFRDNGFKDGLIDEFQAFDAELTAAEISRLAATTPSLPVGEGGLPSTIHHSPFTDFSTYLARVDEPHRAAAANLRALRGQENRLSQDVREIMVMRELDERRPAHVLRRGAYDQPGDPVEPGVPEKLFAFPAGLPHNRLGLAEWLTDPRHPLTARVAVNHFWKLHFGRGLVPTVQDFGSQGRPPSHPELLDWLSRRFVDSGWDVKSLQRLIVTSATYRRASSAPAELTARDPENELLARGPRHRLSAEQIRDGALAASGLLVPKIGGPSVKPYQPAGVWEDAGTGKSYSQDKGDALHRRSLYTFWRRTAPPPNMLTFDAPTREVCTAKREVTGTPLQALVLLNDTQFIEAARVLAERLLREHPDRVEDRLDAAFLALTGRRPEPREREILRRLLDEQRAAFAADPAAAEKYLAHGERPRDASLPVAELAATTVLASAVMNHDEFVMKR